MLDPVLVVIGPLQVRWYGLAYLVGFVIAAFVLDKLARDGFIALTRKNINDLIGVLVLGVMVGGRIGYALFYERSLLLDPLGLARIWKGGLSFHGGLAGCVLGTMIFARRRGIPWPRLADAMVLAAPFGIFLVRCANFINGELYGRIAPAWLPWGMKFPTDPLARALSPELARGGSLNWYPAYERLQVSGEWDLIAARLPLRHPSQLYEALLEGLVVGAVVWGTYQRVRRNAPLLNAPPLNAPPSIAPSFNAPSLIAPVFLIAYASARFAAEFFRQPDAQLGFVLGPFSMGQLLSLAVGIAGAVWLFGQRRREQVL